MFKLQSGRLFGKSTRLEVLRLEDRTVPSILGTADSFAILAGSTVTNTGPTTIVGNLGVNPGLAVTGFPPGLVSGGTIHAGDAVAIQAENDVTTAYNTLAGEAVTQDLTGKDLGGLTLTTGVYRFASSAQLTGTLTLDAQGDPNARFDFQIGSTLTTAPNSSVRLINGADGCNVFWQVGSSATVDTATQFEGNILALTSITLNTGATILDGRALARNGAVTLDTNRIASDCDTAAINGLKFNDHNGNGVQDAGDEGLAGWHVLLNGVDRATTDATGNYGITALASGTYTLQEVQQPGWTETKGLAGYSVTLVDGQVVGGIDFGNFRNVTLSGHKFSDHNSNGVQDVGDEGLPGVTVFLDTNANDTLDARERSTTTDVNGNYSFTNVGPGTYNIREVQRAGVLQTTPNPTTITVRSGQDVTGQNFGDFLTVAIVPPAPPGPGTPGAGTPGAGTPGAGTPGAGTPGAGTPGAGTPALTTVTFSLVPTFPLTTPSLPTFVLNSKDLLLGSTVMANADGMLLAQANFVSGLYQNVLGRSADDAGLTGWVQMLQDGLTRSQVADSFWQSGEHRIREVNQFYAEFLHRAPGGAEQAYWVNTLQSGTSELTVMGGFLTSPEYLASHRSDAAFVNGLYGDVLGRAFDSAGQAAWLQALAGGTSRAAVAQSFLTSAEASERVVDDAYTHFLGRPAGQTGAAMWTPLLQNGTASIEAVLVAILSSDEYLARVNRA